MKRFKTKGSVDQKKDHFPHRPMRLDEAQAIWKRLSDLAIKGMPDGLFQYPASLLPPGGFVSVVEAFAHCYVTSTPLNTEDDELLEHFRKGIITFASSAPDEFTFPWRTSIEDYQANPGMHATRSLCANLSAGIMETQKAWGLDALDTRIKELRKEYFRT